jgi:hypothetical protein
MHDARWITSDEPSRDTLVESHLGPDLELFASRPELPTEDPAKCHGKSDILRKRDHLRRIESGMSTTKQFPPKRPSCDIR